MEVRKVQLLANGSLHKQSENSKTIEGITVPVISLSQPHDQVVDVISRACSEWGFFLITDHRLQPELIGRLENVGHEFFKLPQEEKERYANDPSSGKIERYGTKITKNLEEKLNGDDYYFHLMSPSKVNYEIWPQKPTSYRY